MSAPTEMVSPVNLRWDMEVVNEEVGTTETEIICGVGNDCIIFPDNNMAPTEVVTVNCHPEFLDIQVVEEEVVGESWDVAQANDGEILQVPIEQFKNPPVYEHDEVEIPLPEDQDSYTTMRPYPCDFCSRRFRKKANLTNHMIAHQSDRPHGCNLCGARYHRKSDLVTHMKIHAYAPGQEISDDDEMQYAYMQENNKKIQNRRKKPVSPKKRKNTSPGYDEFNDDDIDVLDLQRQAKKKTSAYRSKNNSSTHNYVDEDMKLMMQSTSSYVRENVDRRPPKPRFTVTDESRPYVCQHCGVGFAREKALGSHSRVHAGDTAFECASCGELFWDSIGLKEHSRVKHGLSITFADEQAESEPPYTGDERFGEFNCEICGLGFHRYDLLKRHRRVHIKSECAEVANTYVCQVCSNSFADQNDLLAHVETHARYQPHRCMLCGECFMDGPAVASHVRRKHAKDIPANACTQCGKTCKDRRSLQKHSWVHSVERSFSCFKCGKRFHSRARLKRHMVSHRDKAVSCDDCGEEFPDGRALINHRHSHTKDLSSRQFHCVECGKTFGSRSSQQIHARIHTGERPYGCRFCWKAFADGGTLRKHERIHTGEKPYACPICPRAFNQRVVLREHVRSHHSGPDRSGQLPLFLCKVCNASMLSSEELCAHLISHSDENTAKHRAPRVGPRKYKRRRKLNSYELNRIAGTSDEFGRGYGSGSDMDMDNVMTDRYTDDEDDEVAATPKLSMKKKLKAKRKAATDRNLDTVVKTFESVVENFNYFVDSAQSDTKKSQKKKLKLKKKSGSAGAVDADPDAGASNADASNVGGFVRTTRPSGQPRVRPRTKNVTVKTLAALKSVSATATAAAAPPLPSDVKPALADKSKVGPRTKNVSYHNVKLAKLPSATFPVESKPAEPKVVKAKAKRKAPAVKTRKKPVKKEVVVTPKRATNNGRSASPRKNAGKRLSRSPTKAGPEQTKVPQPPPPPQESSVNGNSYEDEDETLMPAMEHIEIKQEYACEMCGETFTQRADLLIHVPIHI